LGTIRQAEAYRTFGCRISLSLSVVEARQAEAYRTFGCRVSLSLSVNDDTTS
jgi:hypothetical protein